MSTEQKFNTKRELVNLMLMLLGSFIAAIAVNVFYLPSYLTMGGISGLASVIYHLSPFGLSLGLLTLLLNLPVFLLGLLYVSKAFIVRSLIGTFTFSFLLDITHVPSQKLYTYLVLSGDVTAKPDLFLCGVSGGVLFGLGLGIVMLAKYTTGGTDILAVILHKKVPRLSLGMALGLIDGLVIVISAVAYFNKMPDSLNMALYSTISLYLCAKAIDLLTEGFNFKRTAMIISERAERIAELIMEDLGRGVTGLSGQGMFTKKSKTVLLCVLAKSQIPEARRIVSKEDPKAFFFVMDTREVLGEGFEDNLVF